MLASRQRAVEHVPITTCWPWGWYSRAEQAVQEVASKALPQLRHRAQQQAISAAVSTTRLAALEQQLCFTSQQCEIVGKQYKNTQEQLASQQEQHEQQVVRQEQLVQMLQEELEHEKQWAGQQRVQRVKDWGKMVVVCVLLVLGVVVREVALVGEWKAQQRQEVAAKEQQVAELQAQLDGMRGEVGRLVASAKGIRGRG